MQKPLTPLEIGQLAVGGWFLLVMFLYFVFVFLMPLCAVIATLNIRRIRKELQQLNETLALPSRRL